MAKWMYVKHADLKPLVDWLKTKPEGECKVIISGTADALPALMEAMTNEGRSFVQWLMVKMQSGQLEIQGSKGDLMDLPLGVVVED